MKTLLIYKGFYSEYDINLILKPEYVKHVKNIMELAYADKGELSLEIKNIADEDIVEHDYDNDLYWKLNHIVYDIELQDIEESNISKKDARESISIISRCCGIKNDRVVDILKRLEELIWIQYTHGIQYFNIFT